jgi:hypothetical protein
MCTFGLCAQQEGSKSTSAMRDMFALAPAEDWRDVRVELPKGTEDIKQVCHTHIHAHRTIHTQCHALHRTPDCDTCPCALL